MVAITLNENYIFAKLIKNCTGAEMIKTYQKIVNRMRAAGLGLNKHVLNNKCPQAMKEFMKENDMEYELVPLGQHHWIPIQ
jgi:hypothetical protein